ncbi:Uncharacterised protein [Klebsiella pneumoniae]|nr:Uncharacterised protein [Klebsiella pneumoniae]
MVEGESQDTTGLQESMRLTPALGKQPLIETIWIFRLASPIGYCLQRLWGVLGAKDCWVFVLERQAKPYVEEIGQLRIVQ